MGFLKDSLTIFKKNELVYIGREEVVNGVYSFHFVKPSDLTWHSGQHGLFTITHRKMKDSTRPLSVASSPKENILKITTTITDNPSHFKKGLTELEKGMTLSMSGPVGSFYLSDKHPTLLIANGIGITPFRAMLKQIESQGTDPKGEIHLIYLQGQRGFIYESELRNLGKDLPITVAFIEDKSMLNQAIDQFVEAHKNNGKYYIAGSKSMVESVTNHLKQIGITKKNIRKDAFTGLPLE
ncbi:FAD-dependent oxidoreductase [Alkalicoccobacillus porphyridii]|uniref:FAD-dependent oxidoreductase n=1 Tax=Alkalicoccobacillus porphyridii TaxID=2597270 RepID=A0A553ZVT8_9BACI|nr:FAD-dependent oxidoreductase [Alkalicoccobacillus porphyridii]TSB45426.1 FAD-dependent oxidoreductase [Alkalicoccobacillus porphyridii]